MYPSKIVYLLAWNYNTNRNNMQENLFKKVYWIRQGSEVECDSL